MADKKLRFALLDQFKKKLTTINKAQDINLYSQQWAADALIESYGYDNCIEIMDYYFIISASPDWTWFTYNYEKVLQSKRLEDEDMQLRAKLRAGAKKWLEK
jgi:hypothetical protein